MSRRPDRHSIAFPPFDLDLEEGRLWRAGEEVPLKPRAFALLRYLATHPRRLISKAELLGAVWEGGRVSDATIRGTLRELRHALGEDSGTPPVIQTVHGRGYRFVGAVDARASVESRLPPPRAPEPIFGRSWALRELRAWLADATAGRRRVGFVTGEAGIGKTALVDVFRHEVESDGILCGHGQCISGHGDREPYRPLLEAIGRVCRGPGRQRCIDLLRAHAPTWLLELPGLLQPSERRRLEARNFRVNEDRMLRELADAVEAIGADEPLVLILEDVHWSDSATLGAVELLARRTEPARVLVVCTHRPEPPGPRSRRSRLAAMRAELHLHRLCSDLPLRPLPVADVQAYLDRRFAGVDALEDLAHSLFRLSEGNPLVLVSYADEMVRDRAIVPLGAGWRVERATEVPAIPQGVRAMIEHQIDQISQDDQRALEAASVAGVELQAESLAAAFGPVLPHLDEQLTRIAREHGIVQRIGIGRLRFRHALHREILYERLPVLRKKELHLRLGLWLETRHGEDTDGIAAELSLHFEHGGDIERSVRYGIQAADAAIQRSAHREAGDLLRDARSLLASLPDSGPRRRLEFEVLTRLGNCLSVTEGYTAPEVHDVFQLAYERSSDLDERAPELISVLSGLCGFYTLRAEHVTAYRIGRQQLEIAKHGSDPYDRLVAAVSLSSSCYALARYEEALDHVQAGLAAGGRRLHATMTKPAVNDVVVHALAQSALALVTVGRLDEGRRRMDEALLRARELEHVPSTVLALFFSMITSHGMEDYDAALAAAESCLEQSLANAFPYYIPNALVMAGSTKVRTGKVAEGVESMEQGVALLQGAGALLGQPSFLALLAEARGEAGDVDRGLQCVAQGLEMVEQTGELAGLPDLHCARGTLLALRSRNGDDAESLRQSEGCYRKAIDLARECGARIGAVRPAILLAGIQSSTGREEEARGLLRKICEGFVATREVPLLERARRALPPPR